MRVFTIQRTTAKVDTHTLTPCRVGWLLSHTYTNRFSRPSPVTRTWLPIPVLYSFWASSLICLYCPLHVMSAYCAIYVCVCKPTHIRICARTEDGICRLPPIEYNILYKDCVIYLYCIQRCCDYKIQALWFEPRHNGAAMSRRRRRLCHSPAHIKINKF